MRYLNVNQVMDKLNMSRSHVYSLIKKGILPSVNIGGCIRVPEMLLDKMIFDQLEGINTEAVEDLHVLSGGRKESRLGK